MRIFASLLSALALTTSLVSAALLPNGQDASSMLESQYVPGKYFVMFHNDVDEETAREHQFLLSTQLDRSGGEKIAHQYNFNGFKGYAGNFYPETMTMVRTASEVKYIEPVGIATITGLSDYFRFNKKTKPTPSASLAEQSVQTNVAAWGLTRIWQRTFTNKDTYKYPATAGEGADVYVIDTGVMVNHPEFEGRARWGKVVPKNSTEKDGNGHGTHCAGTVAGKTFGVAKKANIIAVKVLSDSGSGTFDDVVAGILWVGEQVKASGKVGIASMSLGGPKSRVVDDAITVAAEAGVMFVAAAGNSYGSDSCKVSPAGAKDAFTVGATMNLDRLASFSNTGACVAILAPGENVLSAWNNGQTKTISGTSMACPHVSGMAALVLAENPTFTVPQIKEFIVNLSTPNVTAKVPPSTVNKLLFNQF